MRKSQQQQTMKQMIEKNYKHRTEIFVVDVQISFVVFCVCARVYVCEMKVQIFHINYG